MKKSKLTTQANEVAPVISPELLGEKTFEILEGTGLNWTVRKSSLFGPDGERTHSHGIFRNDSNEWLGTVGDRYTPFQNHQMAETIVQAAHGVDVPLTRGGSLRGGALVYLQTQLPDEYIGKSNVNRYITALNSHDGSTSIGFGSSSTVVVCQNTFFRAFQGLKKIMHTQSSKERVETAMYDLRLAMGLDQQLMDGFKRMADMPMKDEVIERVINRIFLMDAKKTKSDEMSTRKKNQIQQFAGALVTEKELEGDTVWALFNAVTRYTNHIVTAGKTANEKAESLMDGTGYSTNLMGFDECMKWVEENTADFVFVG